jgi:polyphenol oxidase
MPGSDLNPRAENTASPGHLTSPLLARAGFRHAFFTRQGGASQGPFESLSFSTAVGDDPQHVEENLRRAGVLLGVDPEHILYLSQVHGRVARFYTTPQLRSATITLEGDAIGGSEPHSAYGVRSADCVPVLLADELSGAVMAIHAGWRGVAGGAVQAGVERLRQNLPLTGRLLAAVGPHISSAAFEVSDEVAAELLAACPGNSPSALLRPAGREKPHVDLRFIVTQQLLSLGLEASAIDHVGGCTLLEPELYFSFRRDGKRSGRHLSAIVPRPAQR